MEATPIRNALERHSKRAIPNGSMPQGGVLLLVYLKDGEPHVLFTRRSESVEKHRGEISFPGGARDPGDATILDTALRETWEEMGVRPDDVETLGELDDIVTISHFVVTPFVGSIPAGYPFRPNGEVDRVIEAPLEAILSGRLRRDDARVVDGRIACRPAFAHRGDVIWGATAMILDGFVEILNAHDSEGTWKT